MEYQQSPMSLQHKKKEIANQDTNLSFFRMNLNFSFKHRSLYQSQLGYKLYHHSKLAFPSLNLRGPYLAISIKHLLYLETTIVILQQFKTLKLIFLARVIMQQIICLGQAYQIHLKVNYSRESLTKQVGQVHYSEKRELSP